MSGNGKAGNGRGNNRRRHFKNKAPANGQQRNTRNDDSGTRSQSNRAPQTGNKRNDDNFRRERSPNIERQRWVPPKLNTEALPVPDCSWCGKPIRDISQAISDKTSGVPIHFECVTERIAENEKLEKGDTITYIGGGRFGIVSFNNAQSSQSGGSGAFKIKKIIEWENNENRALWRDEIREHFSVT